MTKEQKTKIYDDTESKIKKLLIDDPHAYVSYAVPCPKEHCLDIVYVATLEDLDKVRRGALICPFCQTHEEPRVFADFRKVCPKIFLSGETKTDVKRFPQKPWTRVVAWAESFATKRRSLYLFGETGTCKSRMMFKVLYPYVAAKGLYYRVFRGGALREAYSRIYSATYDKNVIAETSAKLKESLMSVDVLVFDDFGQDALTETMLADLWQILDSRFSDGKITIFLSNFAPQDLKERYNNLFNLDSLVRRIEEFSDIVRA